MSLLFCPNCVSYAFFLLLHYLLTGNLKTGCINNDIATVGVLYGFLKQQKRIITFYLLLTNLHHATGMWWYAMGQRPLPLQLIAVLI